jgi:hypothetical protein
MTTTNIKTFASTPHYDDFRATSPGVADVETKNYHRILFRPGYAVQARELTQMQTMLQAQIDRHGQYAFKDGSRVVNGEVSLNVSYDYIKLESTFSNGTHSGNTTNLTTNFNAGTIITGTSNSGNQVSAEVLEVFSAASGVDDDGDATTAAENHPDTLYIKYLKSGGSDLTVEKFVTGEVFLSNKATPVKGMVGGGPNVSGSASTITNAIGLGSAVSISEGVYFISGCFVYVAPSTLILRKYDNNPSAIIGLQVTEGLVGSGADITLLDNAQGTPNFSAPGADRYQIATALVKQSIDTTKRSANEFITLLTVNGGQITLDKTDPSINTPLSIRLAQRTHDESGDYVVKPFELEILEHLDNEAGNFGKYTAANGGSADKIALGIEPATAYVQGYRNEKVGTTFIDIDKPRVGSTGAIEQSNTQINIGNYLKLDPATVFGIPDIINFTTINLTEADGTVIGTARVRGMETFTNPVETRLYIFDITMNSTKSITADVLKVAGSNSFAGTLTVTTPKLVVGNNTSVFKLPADAIRDLGTSSGNPGELANATSYYIKRSASFTPTGGALTINTGGAGNFQDLNDVQIWQTGSAIKTGVDGYRTSGGNGTNSVTYNSSSIGLTDDVVCTVLFTVVKTVARKGKTIAHNPVTKAYTITALGQSGDGNTASWSLGATDIIKIRSVTCASTGSTDYKDIFTLDNGQRENFYDNGKIIKQAGTSPLPAGVMTITFENYEHDAGGDYFSVDSYPGTDYGIIPSFSSVNGNIQLRDCIDFRSSKDAAGTGIVAATATGAAKVGHSFVSNINYYLPRIDKLAIKRDGSFEIISGVASEYPQPPADLDDGLTLYQLRLKPYVFTLADVTPVMQDNKRYTMKDISRLDKRIKNLEYYTSLSLLEQSAADIHMVDANGNPRLKNGILVDSFNSQHVADMSHPECSESIDKENGILRPECPAKNVNLVTGSVSNTASKTSSVWTMPFTELAHTVQPYASVAINVNPYNVFSWAGRVQLSPESDEWKETDIRPDIIIDDDGAYEQFVTRAKEDGILGTVWNEWETNWSGRQVETEVVNRGRNDDNGRWWRARVQVDTIATTTVTSNQARSGLRTAVAFDTVTRETGNKVVETNFVPFMRSRKVYFKAARMKPNTKVYAFFNDIPVTQYCKSEAYQEWSDTVSVQEYSGITTHPDGSSGTLTTDTQGKVTGSYIIPRNETTKFKTGTKEFRLSDDVAGNKQSESTSAETSFHSSGLIESTQRTIVSTKVPRLETTRLNDERVISETFVDTTTEWIDPLAQTILIEKSGGIFASSIDLFFKSKYTITDGIDIPVAVSIVSTANGIPTQTVVPGSEIELYSASVNISDTAATSTRFTFETPVYLLQDQEYAIVIQSDCNEYECWVAEMGAKDITNTAYRINKQPHGGSFFTSQNASTWTPDQGKDLKFTLNRALFETTVKEVTFTNDVIPVKKLRVDALSTTGTDKKITVTHRNHGMHGTSSQVIMAGAVDFNGLLATHVNGTHNIGDITHDSYSITLTSGSNSTVAGSGGGSSITATENVHYDLCNIVASLMTVPDTNIKFFLTAYSQTSIDGSQTPYEAQTITQVDVNKNIFFNSPMLIASQINETTLTGSVKTFTLKAQLTNSGKDHLSPVIDANRLSVTAVQNRIGDNGTTAETNAYGGSELSKYITKRVDLAAEATNIDVYISANRPSSSNIDLYYKAVGSGAGTEFNSEAWIAAAPVQAIPINNGEVYSEVRYVIAPAEPFQSMAFKIILRSKNSAHPPTLKDFRAIAAT